MAKILGLSPRTAAIAGGGALVVAAGVFWWRRRTSSQQQASSSASSTGCTDSSGNSVPCPDSTGIDNAGQLGVIQTELESLLADEGKAPAADKDKDTDKDGGTPSHDPGPPGEPRNLKISAVTATSFRASWTAPAKTAKGAVANGYVYDVTAGSKLVKSGHAASTSAQVSGLHRATGYEFLVRACNHPGCSPNATASVRTK